MNPGQIALSDDQLAIVRSIAGRLLAGFDVYVFGSRVAGRSGRYSDLDLAVRGPSALSLALRAEVQEAFDESDLPFRVDIVDWTLSSTVFRGIIERTGTRLDA
jgi:uncharacterized protein